ncbi:hypothetical protein SLS54_005719 [Diplodia seriata]
MSFESLQRAINVATHRSWHACVNKLEFHPLILRRLNSFTNWSSAFCLTNEFMKAMLKLVGLQKSDAVTRKHNLEGLFLTKWHRFRCTALLSQEMADDIEQQISCILYAYGDRNRYTSPLKSMSLSNRDGAFWGPESLGTLWSRAMAEVPLSRTHPLDFGGLLGLLKRISPILRRLVLIDCFLIGYWNSLILQLPKVLSL